MNKFTNLESALTAATNSRNIRVVSPVQEAPSYTCRVYRCNTKSVEGCSYCPEHNSPLKSQYAYGAGPVVTKTLTE